MKKWKSTILFPIILLAACWTGCYTHWQSEIVVVNNNTESQILVAKQLNKRMTDSILLTEAFSKNEIDPFSSQTIAVPDMSLNNAPDSEKVFLFIFNVDSLNKYKEANIKNFVERCLIKTIEIQLNQVKTPIDTIDVRSN